ncbi:hypothetical protein [Clostridium weizhouense]|uniref:Zinc-finger domain-containing protein n=1 Tax=Clostridium weizhouense TaxID=2859781 RepID=A0ABS7ASH7_9CLOT|nr:hypothetical protein [Clostridium weizhouense]MBW6411614.1 hypothetical protein [Clostridium weizhouense]
MKSVLFNKEGHLTEEILNELKFGTLMDEEMVSVLDHISDCQKCAGSFADNFKDDELAEAPLGFQEKVEIKIKAKKQSGVQFGFYCTKVVVAASIALMILFSNGLNIMASSFEKSTSIKPLDLSILNSVNSTLSSFSEKIINLEVFNNGKEKR